MSKLGKHVQVSVDSFGSVNSPCLRGTLAKSQRTRAEVRAHPSTWGSVPCTWGQPCSGHGGWEVLALGQQAERAVETYLPKSHTRLPACPPSSARRLPVAPQSILQITGGTEEELETQKTRVLTRGLIVDEVRSYSEPQIPPQCRRGTKLRGLSGPLPAP